MNSSEIKNLLKNVTFFKGVFPRDTLPSQFTLSAAFVINTDTASEPGEHWVSVYISHDGDGEYFDHFGLPPLHSDFVTFLDKNCTRSWVYNNIAVQDHEKTNCGLFAVNYIKGRSNGEDLLDFLMSMPRRISKNHF